MAYLRHDANFDYKTALAGKSPREVVQFFLAELEFEQAYNAREREIKQQERELEKACPGWKKRVYGD